MTVAELIEVLKGLPDQDKQILHDTSSGEYGPRDIDNITDEMLSSDSFCPYTAYVIGGDGKIVWESVDSGT